MKAVFIISIFLNALVSNVDCGPAWRKERKRRSVFDIIPVTGNIPNSNSANKDLSNTIAGTPCECKNRTDQCVRDLQLRCRRVIGKDWGRKKKGKSRPRRRRHKKMEKIRRKFRKWLKEN